MTDSSQEQNKASSLLAITGAGLILTLPILIFGLPFLSDDAAFHSAWYRHFSDQLWQGDLYPRWLMDMNGGLGSPVFFFYPPAPYFLTSLLRPLFPNDPNGLHQLGVAASFALIASGLTAYLWLKNLANEKAAMISAILYMAMPYHLASDLYVRASFAEFWAFVWMPLILYLVHERANGNKLALVWMSIAWALLMMTHLPTTLIFLLVPFCYAVVVAPENQKLRTVALTFTAAILGAGLAAIYLVPAIATQQLVLVSKMTTGYFSYANWLFFAQFSWWREDKVTMLLLVADMIGIATCALIIIRSDRDSRTKKLSRFWYLAAIVSVLMMTQLSKPIWIVIQALQRVQFPWRFNTVLTVATTALLAISAGKNSSTSRRAAKLIALALIIVWAPVTIWKASRVFPQTNPIQRDISVRSEEIAQSRDAPEYRPRWNRSMASIDWETSVDEDLWVVQMNNEAESLLRRVGSSLEHPPEPTIIDGVGRATIASRKPRELDLDVETATGVTLLAPQFYYPYWSAHLSPEGTELTITPSPADGLISLTVPAGSYEIQLRLERSRPEQIGLIVSLISLIGVAIFALFVGLGSRLGSDRMNLTQERPDAK